MTPELFTEPTELPSFLTTSSPIGGRAIDRCSPLIRDPLRSKSLNTVLPQTANSKLKSNTKGKKTADFSSPASSRRYLLDEGCYSDEFLVESDVSRFRSSKIEESRVLMIPSRIQSVKVEEEKDEKVASSSSSAKKEQIVKMPSRIQNVKVEELNNAKASASSSGVDGKKEEQVVVLRVSLHCKGCEGKVRKHLSKMEGVKSFTTDLMNKKVTVIGDVTPLGVLNSMSKVKNAQLWPSQTKVSS